MTTHTPEAWAIAEEADQRVFVILPRIGIGAVLLETPRPSRQEVRIATVHGATYEDKIANARLIASAPQLLADNARLRDALADMADSVEFMLDALHDRSSMTVAEDSAWTAQARKRFSAARATLAATKPSGGAS